MLLIVPTPALVVNVVPFEHVPGVLAAGVVGVQPFVVQVL